MKISLILYSLFLLAFLGFSYLFVDPNLVYLNKIYTGFAFQNRGFVSIIYLSLISVFFIFYFYFLKRIELGSLKKIIFVSVFLLLFAYPAVLSYDIFNYVFTSKVLFYYHENPYIIMPIEFINDPLLLFTHAANKVALYGPFWIFLTGIPHHLGLNNFILTLFGFKLIVAAIYLGIVYLIFKITKDPQKTAFFALNPLVLIETLVSGHNDVAMMFFALLSFYFLKKEKFIRAVIFITISILIKYATIFLIPVFIYYLFLKLKKQKMDWNKTFLLSSILMFVIFFLAPIREEIYPWYGIWFIVFVALIPKYKLLHLVTVLLSFVLLLRYVPFMYLGTYFGPTPVIKITVTFVPLMVLIGFYLLIKKRVIGKKLKLR